MVWNVLLMAALSGTTPDVPPSAPTVPVQPDRALSCPHRDQPDYPDSLRDWGNSGHVTSEVTFDKTGHVAHVEILESTHPGFERATLQWMAQLACDPAIENGQPVASTVTQRMNYFVRQNIVNGRDLPGDAQNPNQKGFDIGVEAFQIPNVTAPDLPDVYRYDKPPQLVYVGPIVYPFEMLKNDRTGRAVVSILVGPDGRVYRTRVLEATDPPFGEALAASVAAWHFKPAIKNDKPSWALISFEHEFTSVDRDAGLDDGTLKLLSQLAHHPEQIALLKDLDARPVALSRPAPVYPVSLRLSKVAGSALIEFYLTPDGQARLPTVVSADQPEFGWAAAAAVARWSFLPPTRQHQPTTVRIRVPVKFAPPQTADLAPPAPASAK